MRKTVSINPYDVYNCRCTLAVPIEDDKVLTYKRNIISSCPHCGGIPVMIESNHSGILLYVMRCNSCHEISSTGRSPEEALEYWELDAARAKGA